MCHQKKVTAADPWMLDAIDLEARGLRVDYEESLRELDAIGLGIPERSMVVLSWIAVKEYKIAGYSVQLWTYPANSIVPIKTVLDFHQDHYNAMRCARTWAAQYEVECKGVVDEK